MIVFVSCEKSTLQPPQQQQQQPQQQQPPPPVTSTAGPAPASAPSPAPATSMVAPSPIVYQQLPGGQIQMLQLPPGYVPVLVSNTGNLQPLVSLQQQPPPPQQSQGVPAEQVVPAAQNTLNFLRHVNEYSTLR